MTFLKVSLIIIFIIINLYVIEISFYFDYIICSLVATLFRY